MNRTGYRKTKAIAYSHEQYKAMRDGVTACGTGFGLSLQMWLFILVNTGGSLRHRKFENAVCRAIYEP